MRAQVCFQIIQRYELTINTFEFNFVAAYAVWAGPNLGLFEQRSQSNLLVNIFTNTMELDSKKRIKTP
jgi:hypothetical protein